MSDTATGSPAPRDDRAPEPRRRADNGGRGGGRMTSVRARVASLVWLLAVVAALFLAVGALFKALDMNPQNQVVHVVYAVADRLDPFEPFKTFSGKDAQVESALTNWGLTAVVYLVVGKVLDKLIRP